MPKSCRLVIKTFKEDLRLSVSYSMHSYLTREAARQDVFDYIEVFYSPKRKHTNNGILSPVDFEVRQQKLNEAGV